MQSHFLLWNDGSIAGIKEPEDNDNAIYSLNCAHAPMTKRILVVCTGNICRSPMAEGLFRSRSGADDRLSGSCITIKSAGIAALVDEPAAELAVEVMKTVGVDISNHLARQIDSKLVTWSDLILVAEKKHRNVLMRRYPSSTGKVLRIGEFDDIEISDPYGGAKSAFIETLGILDKCVTDWIEALANVECTLTTSIENNSYEKSN